MADYFTSEHFKLLNKWRGQPRDASNPEQNHAYGELKRAYLVTEQWANALQKKLFPLGRVEIRKRPTNQGNNFSGYNWAKIYPLPDSPSKLAYTVGIDATKGFVVKIDTVGLDDSDPVRKACLELRGEYGSSPIGAALPSEDGLGMSLAELVDWSAQAIAVFKLRYDEVAAKLGIGNMDDAAILSRFDGRADFKEARSRWTAEQTSAFCMLARAVNDAGLDWWHTEIKPAPQVRFGRKQPGAMRAAGVLGYVQLGRTPVVATKGEIPGVQERGWVQLASGLVSEIEHELRASRDGVEDWKTVAAERPGLWPDQLQSEQADLGDWSQETDASSSVHQPRVRGSINRIYYGPPGTGKTWRLKQIFAEYTDQPADVDRATWEQQLLARYGWRAVIVAALADAGKGIKVAELVDMPLVKAKALQRKRSTHLNATMWSYLQEHAVLGQETVNVSAHRAPYVFIKGGSSEWSLTSDWRDLDPDAAALIDTWRRGPSAAEGPVLRYRLVTFHPSYSYEDFVIGLRPVVVEGHGEASSTGFRMVDGVFKQICAEAQANPAKQYALFIDEINRANIAKVFGELITLIEPDKRARYDASGALIGGMEVQLPGTGGEGSDDDRFGVPENLDIYGTMNTADRSIALLDIALRRRFEFEEMPPDYTVLDLSVDGVDLRRLLRVINDRLEFLADRDRRIGHAYFARVGSLGDLRNAFRLQVIPLLQEYFFDDWGRIEMVLSARNGRSPFIQAESLRAADLFGGQQDVGATERVRYAITAPAGWTREAFQSLYLAGDEPG